MNRLITTKTINTDMILTMCTILTWWSALHHQSIGIFIFYLCLTGGTVSNWSELTVLTSPPSVSTIASAIMLLTKKNNKANKQTKNEIFWSQFAGGGEWGEADGTETFSADVVYHADRTGCHRVAAKHHQSVEERLRPLSVPAVKHACGQRHSPCFRWCVPLICFQVQGV